MKKKPVLFVLGVFIVLIIAYKIYDFNKSPFLKSTSNFDVSFVKKIEMSLNGNTYIFDEYNEVEYLKEYFEGNSYYPICSPSKCSQVYFIEYISLIDSFEEEKLRLIPTGDDCGFWGPEAWFPSERFTLDPSNNQSRKIYRV